MFSDFRKTFFPALEEIKKTRELLETLTAQCIEKRKSLKLVCDEKCDLLFRAEPFTSFIGDCRDCEKYQDCGTGVSEGGWCCLHKLSCGWGFVCKDYDGEYPFDISKHIVNKKRMDGESND